MTWPARGIEPVAAWWGRWRSAVVWRNAALAAAFLVLAAMGVIAAFVPPVPFRGAPPPTPSPAPIASGDPFSKAIALSRVGLDADALTEIKAALTANPQATLPDELRRLIVSDPADPFDAARRLAAAGLDDKAKEEMSKQLAARPGVLVPADLHYLTQRPGEVFVDGRLDPVAAWRAVIDPRTRAEIVVRDLAAAAVALLLVFGLLLPLVGRATSRRYRIEAFQEEAASPALGKTIAVLVEDELERQGDEGGGARLEFVRNADAAIALPEALKALPTSIGWITALFSLLPNNTCVVGGTLHARGARGVGMSVAMASPSGAVRRSVTLWEAEFDPLYSPPDKEAEQVAATVAYQRLALGAATWLLYQLREGAAR